MSANPMTLLRGYGSIIATAKETGIISPIFAYEDECRRLTMAAAANAGDGGSAGAATAAKETIAPRTRTRRTAAARTRTPRANGWTPRPDSLPGQVMSYFEQHPTAAFNLAQIREVSPFKGLSDRNRAGLSQALKRLTDAGMLTKIGNGWQLVKAGATVIPPGTVQARRQQRTARVTRPGPAAAQRTGTEG